MGEAQRKPTENLESNLGLEGFGHIFAEAGTTSGDATTSGAGMSEPYVQQQMEKLLERFTELISLSVDQRVESAKMATQLIENQRQLIRLMERSIELTRHIGSIEERLPAVFELPRLVESLRQRVAQLEGIEQ